MTKSTITRERLEKIKSWRDTYGAGSNVMLPAEEAEELARMALAAMDSEPVAEVVSIYGDPEAFGEREIRPLVGIQQMPYGTKLYRHAQQPVVPEEMTIRDACKFVQDMRLFDDVSVIVMRTWNACRAAMLQELKKSAGTEAICRSNENVQAVEVQSLTSINPAPDLVSLQKKAESIIGNSPAIPDAARDALEKALTAMEFMGDTLNNLDAVCSEDVEFVTPAFDAVRRVLAAAQQEVNHG
ncbi:hypothetical protein [Klebsiella variicola]|uniref:hypothetical protein n=1 Tax=Klebsiella variicola TaxID=244366 RepID=UPI0034D66C80